MPVVDGDNRKPIYFININSQPSDAVISKIEGEKITLWLVGATLAIFLGDKLNLLQTQWLIHFKFKQLIHEIAVRKLISI